MRSGDILMDINSAMKLINQIAKSGVTSGSSQSMPQKASKQWISDNNQVQKINSAALDAVARHAVRIVKTSLGEKYPPSSNQAKPLHAERELSKIQSTGEGA
jgi:hypothetical protein